MGTVSVEVLSWVTKFVGGDGSGRRVFDEPVTSISTVRSVLEGLSARFPETGGTIVELVMPIAGSRVTSVA